MSKIYLPLKSNSVWFVEDKGRAELEKRIKNYTILYDEIIIQDGRYVCRVGETGSFDIMMSPDAYPGDRTKIKFYTPGNNFAVQVKGETIIGGKADIAYETDFYPILYDAGVVNASCYTWARIDLKDDEKKIVNKEVSADLNSEELNDLIPTYYFQKKNVIESFYTDSLLSFRIQIPFLSDHRMAPIINWKNQQSKIQFKDTIEELFYNFWLKIGLPDFGMLGWEQIHEIRESDAGNDYRKMINRISETINQNIGALKNQVDLELIVGSEFSRELVNELLSRLQNLRKVFFNLGLNLIPYASVAFTGAKDLKELITKRKSWVSLLEI
jgi:hypothetical protein